MSVIQQIQEKYAKLMAVIIAVALIIFVVMLAFESGGSLFRWGNSNSVGKVNGKEIDFASFQKLSDRAEASLKSQYAQYGGGVPEGLRFMAQDEAWSSEVARLLVLSETGKLGMQIGKKEVGDILYGDNPPNELRQAYTDSTGVYNAAAAKSQIDKILRSGKAQEKAGLNEYLISLEEMRLTQKYNSLLLSTLNYPKWMIEKENADNSQLAKVSFVAEAYTSIPDSSVTVSNKEIEDYISKHKDDFKQEESRSIAYVTFSALPTASDSAAAKQKLLEMKAGFDTTANTQGFLEGLGVQNYYNSYINGSRIQVPSKDSIFRIPVNTIYGPYLDGSSYSLAKLIGVRTQPDTVKVRHILIGTMKRDPQSGQTYPVRDSATAYKLADSVMTAIRNGSNFDSLVVKFSDDDGSNTKGGVYENVPSGQMVAEFNDFIFGRPVGSKGIVNTAFGSHYIEILSQKGSSSAYNIAYLTQPIEVSSETDANALNEASKFAGNSRDMKSFDANADKLKAQGINKLIATNIAPAAYQVPGLGMSRPFVKNIYDAKRGEVLQPEKVGDNYVVAIVTEVNKKGLEGVATARPKIEPLLIKHKKAEMLIKKLGTPASLEAAATTLGGKPIQPADSVRLNGQSAISHEPKVVGAAFNPANKGKVSLPLEGINGVYVIRVDNVTATSVIDANVPEQRKQRIQQVQMQLNQMYMQRMDPSEELILKPLRNAARIKDNRGKVF